MSARSPSEVGVPPVRQPRSILAIPLVIAALAWSAYADSGTNGCAPPAGLVAWWPLDGNGYDVVGSNTLVPLGRPAFQGAMVGQGLAFDGLDDAGRTAASPALDLGSGVGLTVELWILPASVAQPMALVEWSDTASMLGVHFYASSDSPGSLFANLIDTHGVAHHVSSADGLLRTSQFQHVALSYDRASGMATLYLDGAVVAESVVGHFVPETRPDVYLGQRVLGGAAYRFQGVMDEVSFYSRALLPSEIQAIYDAGAAGKCPAEGPPQILRQPQDKTVVVGGTAQFDVVATGTPPLQFQWLFQEEPMVGETNAALVLAAVQPTQQGPYVVVVRNSSGSVTSNPVILTVTPPPSCVAFPTGLAAWWPFEGDATDIVGGRTAVLSGEPGYSGGNVGQGLQFDGVDDGGRVDASPALDVGAGGALTIELWVKPFNLSREQAWVEWSDQLATVGVHFWMSVSSPFSGGGPGSLFANLIDTEGRAHHVSSPSGLLRANEFQHVALTYDQASGLARMYRNGAKVSESNVGAFIPETRTDVYFGRRWLGGTPYWFSGVMDEVGFYSRALEAAEIEALFNAGSAGKCAVGGPPAVVRQPQNAAVYVGDTARFMVVAVGTPPLAYQWYFKGESLPDQTGASLALPNVQPEQAGSYRVVVTSGTESVTSSNAVLTVNPRPPCAPAPQSLAAWWPLNDGGDERVHGAALSLHGNPVFTDGAVGPGLLLDGVDDFARVDANPALEVGAGEGMTVELWMKPAEVERAEAMVEWSDEAATVGVHFWASVSSPFSGGGPGSLFANLIDTEGRAHHVSSAPGILQASVFQHVALTYDRASGVARMYRNGASVGETNVGRFVPETRTAVYVGRRWLGGLAYWFRGQLDEVTLYGRALAAEEIQSLHAAGAAGKCPTNEPPVPVGPSIVSPPAGLTVVEGSTATFAVVASGTAPLSYQWLFEGVELPGETQPTLTLASVGLQDAGRYAVRVTNAVAAVVSTEAVLVVEPDRRPPAITQQPASRQVTPGSTAAFTVLAAGASPLTYQWQFNEQPIADATNSTLLIANAQPAQAGSYTVVVSNAFGFDVSVEALLSVTEVFVGGTVNFANRGGPVNAPVFDVDGVTKLAGYDYRAELLAGPTIGTMAPVGSSVPFLSDFLAGYFLGGVRAIPTVAAGGTAHVQVRAWDFTRGTNFDQAVAHGGRAGVSIIFTVVTGGGGIPPALPASLTGLESFSLLPGVSATPMAALLAPAGRDDDGALKWTLRGQPGVAYLIEVSTNLTEWSAFSAVTLTQAVATFRELPGQQRKYYRARVLD